jgi:hypothetical protein
MNFFLKRHLACWVSLVFLPLAATAQTLPDTEKGNVLLRAFDQYNFGPLFPTYIGHVGIMGEWQGPDPNNAADYDVYDMQSTSITVRSTWTLTFYNTMVQKRSFWAFTSVNALLNQSYLSYDGGFVRRNDSFVAPPGSPMDPDRRDLVVDGANSWSGTYLTTKFIPFVKWPSTNTFRCDGIVEYIMEQAGVGGGQGFWRLYFESMIASPSMYPLWMVAEREHGKRPTMTVTTTGGGSVTNGAAISSTTIYVTATEESTGSGLKKVELLRNEVLYSSKALSGLTANETFASLSDGSYSVAAYDLAGNKASLAFTVDPNSSSQNRENKKRESQPSVMNSSNCLVAVGESIGGIESIAVTGPGMSSTATWTCGVNASTSAMLGPFCNLAEGSYATTIAGCNGKQSVSSTTVVAGTFWARLAGQGEGDEKVSQAACSAEILSLGQSTFSLHYNACNVAGYMVEMMCVLSSLK